MARGSIQQHQDEEINIKRANSLIVPTDNSGSMAIVGLVVIILAIVFGSYFLHGKQIDNQNQRPVQTQRYRD